ncbi:enoyl-CoA hydratase/isomerase family protein [Aquabacterium sp.]|uniref:enoyl-CoA hydratase/isomerase family protein n=1 Tax=Aquabacterium sp. TaxID=1872578 RepID=UPI003783B263
MSEADVRFEREGAIAWVTLARPAKLHALTPAMLDRLEQIARAIDADVALRAVVLTAEGERAFCVGADIGAWSALPPLDMWRQWTRRGHQVFDQWARLRQPVIAALNGHAFGGGLELAITADLRLASTGAEFALPEASIATCPGWSGSQRLVRLVGPAQAKYLALGGQRIGAERALACGLVHELHRPEALLAAARALAEAIAARAPVAVQLTKQLIDAATGEGTAAALEGMAGALSASTADAAEGLAAFRERRPAQFRGQ